MKIYLAEEHDGHQQNERAFELLNIKIGRDSAECQISFDPQKWTMVSRKHAELRLEGGRYVLVDTGSSFGTFFDGQRISQPTEVSVGCRLQFGEGGPLIRITRIEQSASLGESSLDSAAKEVNKIRRTNDLSEKTSDDHRSEENKTVKPAIISFAQTAANQKSQNPDHHAPGAVFLELIDHKDGAQRKYILTNDVTRIGREYDLEVRIDADAAAVSRRHAELHRRDGRYVLVDLGSFNGTLLNGKRITAPTPLTAGDRIQLGLGGPVLLFTDPAHPASQQNQFAESGSSVSPLRLHSGAVRAPTGAPNTADLQKTLVANSASGSLRQKSASATSSHQPEMLMWAPFGSKTQLTVGRGEENDICLDGLQISKQHARVIVNNGAFYVEDLGSTNGVYVNGVLVENKQLLDEQNFAQIGPFMLRIRRGPAVEVLDTRAKTRIDAVEITKVVANRSTGGDINLLDGVSLTIQPNEFVGLLGPSGAGKSTFMDALNGMRPATGGQVLINSLDLYEHLESLKQSIGYVPQDDIIHRELSVYRTLYYVARLRLSRDVSKQEIDQLIAEVMDLTGLSERRDVPVAQLSGGQRKRVSIAVELVTKPSLIFLDEPTSGLDPATEDKIMRLFRQIAESGRTVILTTHAMENVKLFDKIVVLMRGRLVFYGKPDEALTHVGADSFKDLYDKLEAPMGQRVAKLPRLPADAASEEKKAHKIQRERIIEEVAEEWKQRFQQTTQYEQNVKRPQAEIKCDSPAATPVKQRRVISDVFGQWKSLSQRYVEVLSRDRMNLLILFGQAPIIALLTYLVVRSDAPRDFPFFMLALVAIWFGTSIAAREVIRERAVYNRERMVGLGLLPYVGSKLTVLSLIVGIQCLLLFGILKLFHATALMKLPGEAYGLPQLSVMFLTGLVGIALGLFISAVVKTPEMATSLVPLILIPQILFSGLVGVPDGLSKVVGALMPATWSFDGMKRLSVLDTLREEGSRLQGENKGRGLYKHLKDANQENLDKARDDLNNYKENAERRMKDFEGEITEMMKKREMGQPAKRPEAPAMEAVPEAPKARDMPEDLSNYIDFLHPWGGKWAGPLILLAMFGGLIASTVIALRLQDVGPSR